MQLLEKKEKVQQVDARLKILEDRLAATAQRKRQFSRRARLRPRFEVHDNHGASGRVHTPGIIQGTEDKIQQKEDSQEERRATCNAYGGSREAVQVTISAAF